MKKAIDINIAGIKFSIEEDAYANIKNYLNSFEASITNKQEVQEVMEDVEIRVAELFLKEIKYPNQVVDEKMVQNVINCLGVVDSDSKSTSKGNANFECEAKPIKRLHRSSEETKIAGVCGGIAAYFGIDVTLVRVAFIIALFGYGSTLVLYGILWAVVPLAVTIAQKLEMKGIAVTAENIKNYTSERQA